VLGSVSVEVDGRLVPIGGPLPRRLLAVLLANRGAVLSVDRLAEVLWGDEPSETATSSLHTYVSRLRRLLPPSVRLESAPPGYRLRLDPGAADVERFETALEQALACLADRPEAALAGLEEALSCWQGDAFAEFGGEWWAQGEAARLEELRLQCPRGPRRGPAGVGS
jgi:DNA-binding SARP family transcriptional activator